MDTLQPLLAVIFVLALLGGALLLLKRRGVASLRLTRQVSGGARRMEVVERLTLSPQHALHVVRIGGRSLVVATAPTSCHLLCDVERTEAGA